MDENSKAIRESTREQNRDARGRYASGFAGGGAGGAGGAMTGAGLSALVAGGGFGGALAGPMGYVASAALNAGKEFAGGVGTRLLDSYATGTGGRNFTDRLTTGVLDTAAGMGIPGVSAAAKQIIDPLKAAQADTLAVTGTIARAGGKVDPEMRSFLNARNAERQARYRDEANEVSADMGSNPEAKAAAASGGALERLEESIANLAEGITMLSQLMSSNPGAAVATAVAANVGAGGSSR